MSPTVLLVDDHHLVRHALARAVSDAGFRVVGEAGDGELGMRMAERLSPDLALVDVTMPVLDGIAMAELLRRRCPATRVVMLSMHGESELVSRALAAGAVAFLGKDASMADVEGALHQAWRTRPGALARGDLGLDAGPTISAREAEVLQLVADGHSATEVARRMCISAKTVKNHLHAIYSKLDVGDRTQAVLAGARLGYITLR